MVLEQFDRTFLGAILEPCLVGSLINETNVLLSEKAFIHVHTMELSLFITLTSLKELDLSYDIFNVESVEVLVEHLVDFDVP